MHYGEPVIRRSVPLAIGLLSVSNPQLVLVDTLSRHSHDHDLDVALSAIFSMGLVGAGTNNAKLAQLLRQLANYYSKEPDCLFAVRVAQGLVHMGKAMVGLSPFNTDRFLMSPVAVAGLISTLVAYTDVRGCKYTLLPFKIEILTKYPVCSHLGPIALDALLLDDGYVPKVPHHPQRGGRKPASICARRSSGRHDWPSRQASNNCRFPDAHNTRAVRQHRESRDGYRGVLPLLSRARGPGHPQEERQLRERRQPDGCRIIESQSISWHRN